MAVASESQERSSSETEVASQHLFLTLSSMLPEAQGVGVIRSHRVAFVTDRLGIMRRQDGRNCHVTICKVHPCSYLCHSLLVTFLENNCIGGWSIYKDVYISAAQQSHSVVLIPAAQQSHSVIHILSHSGLPEATDDSSLRCSEGPCCFFVTVKNADSEETPAWA